MMVEAVENHCPEVRTFECQGHTVQPGASSGRPPACPAAQQMLADVHPTSLSGPLAEAAGRSCPHDDPNAPTQHGVLTPGVLFTHPLRQVVIIDEIGTEAEALACRTIAERGVQLIGTAHGQLLGNLMKNPTLRWEGGSPTGLLSMK